MGWGSPLPLLLAPQAVTIFSQSSWALLPPLTLPGNLQMALDRWLLIQHRQHHWPPVLRFYHWQPAAISLGYHQQRWPQRWRSLQWQGQPLEIVRRPTGGRAVLHQGDLTYSLVASGLGRHRSAVYAQLCEFLQRGWAELGLPLHFGTAGRGYIHNPDCFGTATGADLLTPSGAKFIGSAQLWQGEAVLQHGSMRLAPDPALLQAVFGRADALPELPPGQDLEAEAWIIPTLVEAAQDCFGMRLEPRSLSPQDWASVTTLLEPPAILPPP